MGVCWGTFHQLATRTPGFCSEPRQVAGVGVGAGVGGLCLARMHHFSLSKTSKMPPLLLCLAKEDEIIAIKYMQLEL